MGFNTGSVYASGYTEAAFLRREPSIKGDSLKVFFMGTLYMPEINKKIKPQESMEGLTDAKIRKHRGSLSFSIPFDEIPESLNELNPGDLGVLEYGLVPKEFKDRKTNQSVNYMGLVFLDFKIKSRIAASGGSSSSIGSSSIGSSSTGGK